MKIGLYNYRLEKYEEIDWPSSPETSLIDYVPRGAGEYLYSLLIEHFDYSNIEAMEEVLIIACGIKERT